MSLIVVALPLVSALIGWLSHWLILKVYLIPMIRNKKSEMANAIGRYAADSFSLNEMEDKIVSKENIDKIMPTIEIHIDDFLRNKLGKAMPVISMFIGEKTINQLKGIFMTELEELLPATLKAYTSNLKNDIDVSKLVSGKIESIPDEEIEAIIKSLPGGPILKFQLLGSAVGLLIGIINAILIVTVS